MERTSVLLSNWGSYILLNQSKHEALARAAQEVLTRQGNRVSEIEGILGNLSYETEVRVLELPEFSKRVGYHLKMDTFPKGYIPFQGITAVMIMVHQTCPKMLPSEGLLSSPE